MLLTMLHSKIHRARVTASVLEYEGSMGVDAELIEMAGMTPGQQIDVLNVTNGERFTTYVIEEPAGSKTFGIYGAAAHKAKVGDTVIIIAYAQMDEQEARLWQPAVLIMDEDNNVVSHG